MIPVDHFMSASLEPTTRTEVYDALLPTEPAMIRGAQNAPELCQLVSDYDPAAFPDVAYIDPKLDGYRALAFGSNRIIGREGEPYPAASHCRSALAALERAYGEPMFFDGELVHEGGFQKLQSAMRSGKPNAHITYWLFDAIPLAQWELGTKSNRLPGLTLSARRQMLVARANRVTRNCLGIVRGFVMDRIEAEQLAQGMFAADLEGLVVKDASGLYERARTGSWMRMKRHDSSDVEVTGFAHQASTGYSTIQCRTAGGETFSMKLKKDATAQIGNVSVASRPCLMIEVSHSGFTDRGVPRHASFVRIRDDKKGA